MAIIVVVLVAGAGAIAYLVLSRSGDDGNDGKGDTPLEAFQGMVDGYNEKDFEKYNGNTIYAFRDQAYLDMDKVFFEDTFVNNTVTVVCVNLTQIEEADIPDIMDSYMLNQCSGINMSYDLNITDYAVLHAIITIESSNTSISMPTTPLYILMVQIEGGWYFGLFIQESEWVEDNEWANERGGASTPEEAFTNMIAGFNAKDSIVYLKNNTLLFSGIYSLDYARDLWNTEIGAGSYSVTYTDLVLLDDSEVPQLAMELLNASIALFPSYYGHEVSDWVILQCEMTVSADNSFIHPPTNTSHVLVMQVEGRWYVNSFVDDMTWDVESGRGELLVDDYLLYEDDSYGMGTILMRVTNITDTDYEFSVRYMHNGTTEELGPVLVNKSSGVFWWGNTTQPDITPENYDGTTYYYTDLGNKLCKGYVNITEDGWESNTIYVGVNGIIYRYMQGIGENDSNFALKETNITWA